MVGPSPCRPLMMPTTPVLPMPVSTISHPKDLSFSATNFEVSKTSSEQLRRLVQVAPPTGYFFLHLGHTVQYRHSHFSFLFPAGLSGTILRLEFLLLQV